MASVNQLSFNQAAQIIADLHEQTTGKSVQIPTNTAEFVSVATTLKQNGLDPLCETFQQLITRTVFSIRPYVAKFGALRADSQMWGHITRKFSIVDKPVEDDVSFELVDGQSVDMFKVDKPELLNVNFYGSNIWTKKFTTFRNQLNSALEGPEQFSEFVTMVLQNALDIMTQADEELSRATLANFIGGKVTANNGVRHLIKEYAAETGLPIDTANYKAPEYYADFIRWAHAEIEKVSKMMTERTGLYQIQVTDKWVNRHTPRDKQRVFVSEQMLADIKARVLSTTYNDSYLNLVYTEGVNFWQSPDKPLDINVEPVYLKPDGLLETGQPIEVKNIFAVIVDEETLGYTLYDEYSATSPFNIDGGYWNTRYHMHKRWWTDYTEKGVVFLCD